MRNSSTSCSVSSATPTPMGRSDDTIREPRRAVHVTEHDGRLTAHVQSKLDEILRRAIGSQAKSAGRGKDLEVIPLGFQHRRELFEHWSGHFGKKAIVCRRCRVGLAPVVRRPHADSDRWPAAHASGFRRFPSQTVFSSQFSVLDHPGLLQLRNPCRVQTKLLKYQRRCVRPAEAAAG